MNNFKFVESYTKIPGSSESDSDIVTAHKRSLDKVIFSQASVCPRGGVFRTETPMYGKERAVRILLECILVKFYR